MRIRKLIAVTAFAFTVSVSAAAGTAGWWSATVRAPSAAQVRGRELGVMRGDPRIQAFVSARSGEFRAAHGVNFLERYNACFGWYPALSRYYAAWNRQGFLGGFFFPLRPVYDIDAFFWNPFVYWLWGDGWDDAYYETWYGSAWYSALVLRTRFARPGVFFPTEAMRDLARGASLWPAAEQGNLRLGLNDLVNRLQVKLAGRAGASIELARNDLVVTNVQVFEDAVLADGFVGTQGWQFAFKALLGLDDVSQNLLVAPVGQRPTGAELEELGVLNERIRRLGGIVELAPPARVRGD